MPNTLTIEEFENLEEVRYFNEQDKSYQPVDRDSVSAWLLKKGLPQEVVGRLMDLWETGKAIGRKMYDWGKILVCAIVDFIRRHPNTTVGLCVGAVITVFVHSIPLLGQFLGPILTPLTIGIPVLAGYKMDSGCDTILDALIGMVRDFFGMLIKAFKAIVSSGPIFA